MRNRNLSKYTVERPPDDSTKSPCSSETSTSRRDEVVGLGGSWRRASGAAMGWSWVGTAWRPRSSRCRPRPPIVSPGLLGCPLPWRRDRWRADDTGAAHDRRRASSCATRSVSPPGSTRRARTWTPRATGFGYVVGGTVTRAPRPGNPKPRIVRYPARGVDGERDGPAEPGRRGGGGDARARTPRTAPRFVSVADEDVADAVAALGSWRRTPTRSS